MEGFWAVFWLAVVMKLPIVALLWLVWYAAREPAPPESDRSEPGGGSDRDPHRGPRLPRPPRRGPHADPAPRPPARTRASGRPRKRVHRQHR